MKDILKINNITPIFSDFCKIKKIPKTVTLSLKANKLFIKGPLGTICLSSFFSKSNLKKDSSLSSHLFQKSIVSVSFGFVNRLSFIGVNFRVESIDKNFIKLKLGFSHFVLIPIPFYIEVFSPKKTFLILKCLDKHLLKQFCSKICSFKSPDIYKGKGIFYKNQKLSLKEGKKK